jgi:hypothetical protein
VSEKPMPEAAASPVPPPQPVTPDSTPETAPPTGDAVSSSGSGSTASVKDLKVDAQEPRYELPKWRLSTGASAVFEKRRLYQDSIEGNHIGSAFYPRPTVQFGLRYSVTPILGVNGFAGVQANDDFENLVGLWGGELEATPIRLGYKSFTQIFEWGFLAGISNLRRAPGNIGTLHLGSRVSISPLPSFGITGAFRFNAGYLMADAGLIFHF